MSEIHRTPSVHKVKIPRHNQTWAITCTTVGKKYIFIINIYIYNIYLDR